MFPFTFDGLEYHKCTKAASNTDPWCFDIGGDWGNCDPLTCDMPTGINI